MRRIRYGAALCGLLVIWATGCTQAADPSGEPVPDRQEVVVAARPDGAAEVVAPATSPAAKDPGPARTTPPPPSPTPPPPPPVPREKSPVLYLGDSLAMESQLVLGERVEASGRAIVHSAPYSGTTLCDYLAGRDIDSLVPPQDKAAALVKAHRPRAVVLQFWGNSWGYTPCMDNIVQGSAQYYTRYAADAKALTEQIARAARTAGIPRPRIIWVLQGPDAFSTDRTRRVNDLYQDRASASGDTVADAGRAVSAPGERYQWRQRVPCAAGDRPQDCRNGRTTLHRDDDPLHFCLAPTTTKPRPCPADSPGIVRYTKEIASVVDQYLRGIG